MICSAMLLITLTNITLEPTIHPRSSILYVRLLQHSGGASWLLGRGQWHRALRILRLGTLQRRVGGSLAS